MYRDVIIIKDLKKYLFTGLFLILILFVTLCNIYDKESIKLIFENIQNIKLYFVLICFGIIFIYFFLQGLYMKIVLKTLNYDITLKKGMFYSIVEFYFSGITPSSTGGQPVQLYYMTRDNIPIRKSYITLMLNTIYFKLIMLIFGIGVLIVNNSYVFNSTMVYKLFFWIGFIVDLLIIVLGILLIFKTNLIEAIYIRLIDFLKKFKIFNSKLKNFDSSEVMNRYKDEINFVKTHKKTIFFTFVITFLQRLALFSIIYVVYRALGYNTYTYIELLIIQLSVQVSIEAVPLPGGAGLSESMLHYIFVMIFSSQMADIGMLLTRTFTFYVPLIICGVIIFGKYLFDRKKI